MKIGKNCIADSMTATRGNLHGYSQQAVYCKYTPSVKLPFPAQKQADGTLGGIGD